jgi:hypothetical protein
MGDGRIVETGSGIRDQGSVLSKLAVMAVEDARLFGDAVEVTCDRSTPTLLIWRQWDLNSANRRSGDEKT